MTNENHAKQQAAAQLSSIREMLAALNVDYDRLAQLEELEEGKHLDKAELEELDELRQAAGECTSYDEAQQRIHDDPLSVQVRSGWYNPAMIEENATPGRI